ncbi:peptide/nickel transport system substrate-binding protein [Devosia enhydra]|uniref:Peptide/nickel transport system substrate-binding protein n=1 Tax=Devosia enhydra TaxID=665118 RepID=A0A1K2HZH4_9HYPH|nr:ABC transporter substrate-binding protein [Devosia enhydra]SFZ84565.1 peptide/nickel transport system substrate-binding protein [Devosia enhydra]
MKTHIKRWQLALAAILLTSVAILPAGARDLNVAINADPSQVDPITLSELISGDILKNVYQGFTDTDAEGNVVPLLATSWEAHEDGLGFTFRLREGVKFHTGNVFGARDVKATFEQLLIPGNKGGGASQYLNRIVGAEAVKAGTTTDLEGVKVVDDLTVEVRFTEPEVLFPIYPFNFFDASLVGEAGSNFFAENSGGTGPFRFVEWKRGEQVELDAFADYWGGAPAIDGVTFKIVPEETTQLALYETGELDVLYLSAATGRRVLRDPQYADQLQSATAAQINYLGFNAALYEPFRDKRVREAFSIALDREALVNGLFGGAAQPLYGQISPGVGGYDPEFPAIPHDPERAKQLIAEAGYADGLPPLTLGSLESSRTEATYFADLYSQLFNVEVTLQTQERATFIRALNAKEVPFFHFGWTAGYPDALYFLSQVWYSKSPYNRTGYSNPDFDALIEKATATTDPQERYALYHEAERLLVLEDWGTSGTYVRTQLALVKPSVKGVTLTPFRFQPYADVTID